MTNHLREVDINSRQAEIILPPRIKIPDTLAMTEDGSPFDVLSDISRLLPISVAPGAVIRQTVLQFQHMTAAGANLHDYMLAHPQRIPFPEKYECILFVTTHFIVRSSPEREMILSVKKGSEDLSGKAKLISVILDVDKTPPPESCVLILLP